MTFEVGDVVRLKSGGPKMTVTVITTSGVTCVWFVDASSAAASLNLFVAGALEKITPMN